MKALNNKDFILGGADMIRINELYLTLETENKYNNLDEEKILTELLQKNTGSLESAISNIINQAVLEHIHLNIDSTIMQMLVLNNYLINLFIKNFDVLMNNYIVHYLELNQITLLAEKDTKVIKKIISELDLKTEFEEIINSIKNKWNLTK
jgi:hypothetical protein